jgi:hypothetical protein
MSNPTVAAHVRRNGVGGAHSGSTRKSSLQNASERLERLLDHCLENTFPASDPISTLSTREP